MVADALLFFAVLVAGAAADVEPSVVEGGAATLLCPLDLQGAGVVWLENGMPMTNTTRRHQIGPALHFTRVLRDRDSGQFTCVTSVSESDALALNIMWLGQEVKVQKQNPDDVINKDVHLRCKADGNGDIQYSWFRNSEQLFKSDHIIINKHKLHIKNATVADNGVYRCHAQNEAGSRNSSENFVLAIPGESSSLLVLPPTDVLARLGQTVHFKCVFEHTDEIKWFFQSQSEELSNSTRISVFPNGSLIIEAVNELDKGLYSCVGIRNKKKQVYSAQLKIAFLEKLSQLSFEPSMPEDGTRIAAAQTEFEVTCIVPKGEPAPRVWWIDPQGHTVSDTGPVHVDDTRLIVDSLDAGRHSGNYTCVAENMAGSTSVSFQLIVTSPLTLLSGPDPTNTEKLKFSPRPVNKKLELGSESRIYCKAQSSIAPVIKWYKEGETMIELPSHIHDTNGTLVFDKVVMEDKGRYMCIASTANETINATINIDVIVTPKFTVLPQNPTRVIEGQSIMFHCEAEGYPKPTLKWDRNSNFSALEQERFTVLQNGSLWLKEARMSDEGRYGCTAGNSGGFKREEITLIVQSGEGYRAMEGTDEDSMMTKTVTITLTAAAAYMVLVIGLMIWCRYRRRKRKQAYLDANGAERTNTLLTKAENEDGVGEHAELKEVRGEGDGGDTGQSHSSGQSKRSKNNYDRLAISRADLHNLISLGHCDFGEVFTAKLTLQKDNNHKTTEKEKGKENDNETSVVVKALERTKDESALQEFRRQLDMFHRLQSEFVAKLLGLCRDAEPHYLVLEYSDWGDLKQFLLATRGNKNGPQSKSPQPPQLSVTQIIQLANQIALGMEHLANQRLVHKDLAARNCLIASNLTVKVSLQGLCKDTYSKEYCKHHNQLIPLRWLPQEAVFEDDFSTKTDVYSFACLVWEIFHQGELPFSKMSDDAVLSALKKNELQWKPHKAAPQSLQDLLLRCWANSPRDRPTFNELVVTIGEISIDSEI